MSTNIADYIHSYCSCIHEWNASYEDYARSVGLSFTSLSILSAIDETPNCTQKALCERCFLPKHTVNAAVTTLYKNGWITMREWPEDRRNKTIHFTEEGRRQAQQILSRVHHSEQTAMAGLTAAEREQLLSLTKRYITACKESMKAP